MRASWLTLVLGLHSCCTSVSAIVSSSDADAADRSQGNRLFTIDALRHLSGQQKLEHNQLQDIAGGQAQNAPAAVQGTLTNQRGKLSHQQMLDQYNQNLWREAELEAEQESRTEDQLRRQQMSQKKAQEQVPTTQQKDPQPDQSLVNMLSLWWNTTSRVHIYQVFGVGLVALFLSAAWFLTCPSRNTSRSTWAKKAPSHGVTAASVGSEVGQCEAEDGENRSLYLYELTSHKYPDLQELKGDLETRLQAIAKEGRGTAVFAVGSAPPGEMASSCAQQ